MIAEVDVDVEANKQDRFTFYIFLKYHTICSKRKKKKQQKKKKHIFMHWVTRIQNKWLLNVVYMDK